MAIVLVQQNFEQSASIDQDYKRDYSLSYDVYTNSRSDGPKYVRDNFGISLYSGYNLGGSEIDNGSRVKGIKANCEGPINSNPSTGANINGLRYKVTVDYGVWNPFATSSSGSPVDYTPHASIEGVTYEELVKKDVDGTPVLNAAGDPFDPPVMRDQTRCVIHVSRNETSTNIATMLGYANRVNSSAFFGFPARSLKFNPPRFTKDYDQFLGQTYWQCEYEFVYDPDTWDKKVLNCGYKQLGTDSGGHSQQQQIVTLGGATTGPFMLDVNGAYLPPPYSNSGELVVDPSTDETIGPGDSDGETSEANLGTDSETHTVVYLLFQVYESMDFSVFSFPSNLFTAGS